MNEYGDFNLKSDIFDDAGDINSQEIRDYEENYKMEEEYWQNCLEINENIELQKIPPITNCIRDLKNYVTSKKNPNTEKKTELSIRRFQKWLSEPPRNEFRAIHVIAPFELNVYLGGFILNVRKEDGNDYEPDTLTSLHCGIHRHLSDNNYPCQILTDDQFQMSRNVLKARRKELKEKGLGNKNNRAEFITKEEENKIWESGVLGLKGPVELLNLLWYSITKQMGFRGSQENYQLKWGDIILKTDSSGREFLEFNERLTKTRDGNGTVRAFSPKIFPHDDKALCPINAYKLYASQRPKSMMHPEAPFYIGVNFNYRTNSNALWYKSQPIGINKLKTMMKTIAEKVGLEGKKTNHSLRKTMCSNLLHSGVAPSTIMQLSGHKNVASINNYAIASFQQQKEMCSILQSKNEPSILSSNVTNLPPKTDKNEKIAHKPEATCTTSTAHENTVKGLFSGANISGGTFNINFNVSSQKSIQPSCTCTCISESPQKKLRRIVPIIDSDED